MSKRRDWDKFGRERRVYLNGSLPHWSDGWGSTPTHPAHSPAIASRTTTAKTPEDEIPDDIEEQTILTLDFGGYSVPVALPSAEPFQACIVRYTCAGLDATMRERLVQDTLVGLNRQNWDDRIKTFIRYLFQIGHLTSMVTIGRTAVYEFALRPTRLGVRNTRRSIISIRRIRISMIAIEAT